MARISLKNIVGKKNEISTVLESLIRQWQPMIRIEDDQGKLLFGDQQPADDLQFPLKHDDEILGWVKGNEKAGIIAGLLNHMIQKEAEKKKLGTEVLNLYQELNVIFNFSEKISKTIDPDTIARFTLEQALHSIPAHGGVILLWDEENKEIQIPATSGDNLFNNEGLRVNMGLLLQIGLSGQSEIITDLTQLKEKNIITGEVQSLVYAAMKAKHRIVGAIILAGADEEQFSAAHLKLLVTLSLQSSTAIESAILFEKNIREVKEREEAILKIYSVTKKFVPHEFISALGKQEITDVKLGDQVEKIVTVLFTDIRDFTALSEKMTPEENFRFVSSFNERLGPVIRSHGGFINQYLGDSIMAIFPGDADDAIQAAVKMQHVIAELNEERNQSGLSPIKAGIGMHTGPLIMGITGDAYRMDAATISDTVNTAARIESLTKYYKSSLLLSEETVSKIRNPEPYMLRPLGSVRLKGKQTKLDIIECVNGLNQPDTEKKKKTMAVFAEAMKAYQEKDFENAATLFRSVLETDDVDLTAQFFADKAMYFLRQGVPENWSGVEEMASK